MNHVRKAKVFVFFALLFPIVASPAGFDCAMAKTAVEKLICSDSELSQADTELDVLYRRARKNAPDAAKLLADQREWLRQRNACRNKGCLFESYLHRLRTLAIKTGENASIAPGPPWLFELTQGTDAAVCRAYLKRLNESEQANYPFCDRPETGEEFGFTPLKRRPLTNEQLHDLAQRAHGFMGSRNQDAMELANASRKKLGLPPVDWLTSKNIEDYVGKDIHVWQYEPPVDIDNDGKPDRIVVWRGYPVGNHLPGCGWTDKWGLILRDTQMPFFVDETLTRIDTEKTERIFSHPSGGYKIHEGTAAETVVQRFRPIGVTLGIFKYDGIHYFDTFFDSWGDFKGLRRTYRWIYSTLGVFVRNGGDTRQVCEFRWLNNPNDRLIR